MWHQTMKTNEITIPPILKNNLNVYNDVLEPQKSVANSADRTVDKLIDIDDCSSDSGFQDCNINASFLDMNKELGLIDLYQNMLVNPQHIKKKDTATDTVDASASEPLNIQTDFNKFFDTLESGEKIDWMKVNVEERSSQEYDEEKPRVLIPKVFLEDEPDSDPEEIIHEVLSQKNIEKHHLSNIRNYETQTAINRGSTTVENTKKTKTLNDFPELKFNNIVSEESKFESKNNRNEYVFNTKITPIPTQSNDLNDFTLLEMKKDEKIYKKKRIVKPVSQTSRFTKGPNFEEKSLVLPQIMARMLARQAVLDEKNNHKKKFLLDSGATPKAETSKREEIKPKTNNNCLNKPKNRSLDPKLCMNQSTHSIAVHTTDYTCPNCNKVAKKSTGISNVSASSAKKSAATSKTVTVAESIKLAAKKSPVTPKPVTVADTVKLSPVVLMEDCNRERLRALKRTQMFKNFVLNGKFEL